MDLEDALTIIRDFPPELIRLVLSMLQDYILFQSITNNGPNFLDSYIHSDSTKLLVTKNSKFAVIDILTGKELISDIIVKKDKTISIEVNTDKEIIYETSVKSAEWFHDYKLLLIK